MRTTTGRRQRTKGWRKEPGDVCVDRTSRWGNWWRIIADDSGDSGVIQIQHLRDLIKGFTCGIIDRFAQ